MIKRALAAWLALALSVGQALAADVKLVAPVETRTAAPALSQAVIPILPATAIPDLKIPAVNDNAAASFAAPQLAGLALQPQAPQQAAPKADGVDPAVPAINFDGFKAAPQWRSVALAIMAAGSLNLSRTTTVGRKWFAPKELTNEQVQAKAESNFRKAAILIVDHAKDLPLDKRTAVTINKLLTEGLVPEEIRGDPNYHTDTFVFYDWLESPATQRLAKENPAEMANLLHYKMSRLDSFPDGNGRLARLMADLALIREGRAPVYYSDMKDYFARGNHRAKVSPEVRRAYFAEMAARGQKAVEDPLGFKASLKTISGLDAETLKMITANDGHSGQAAVSRKLTHPKKPAKR